MNKSLFRNTISLTCISGLLSACLVSSSTSALTYTQAVDVSFKFNSTIRMDLSSANLIIRELVPGTAMDSNTITVGVTTNTAYGYTLSANVGNNTTYDTRNLIRSDSNSKFTSIDFGSSQASLTTDDTWGFSYKPAGSSTSWTNYSGLPLYSDTNNTATLLETNAASDVQSSIQFKIAAKASNEIPSGAYRNVINFIAVANPEPTPSPIQCEANKICYSENALDTVEGTMGKQDATAETETTLLGSNYSRRGYGFAGWNTAPDYSGTNYGPNEDVTMPADMSNGLALYAIWVHSEGNMQDWKGCSNMGTNRVTALTDLRDGETYAIARLRDRNCWMIENLRLEAENTRGHTNQALSQGYNTSTDYGYFIGLADPETTSFFSNPAAPNSIYYSGTQSGTASIDIGNRDLPNYRLPRYNNTNTPANASDRPSYPTTNTTSTNITTPGMYSYGNYYTWSAATADTAFYNAGVHRDTSICPTGWRIPYNESTFGSWQYLGSMSGISGSNAAASKLWRKYPINLVYSGVILMGPTIGRRGEEGYYWSSTVSTEFNACNMVVGVTRAKTTDASNKHHGMSVRCVLLYNQ